MVAGLLTYFSSGFKFKEIELAVFAGVDGVGIGGAQVLRFMDRASGMHGPYMEENLSRILSARDEAAASVRGRGVFVLARLDTMFFEGSITREENIKRTQLFDALKHKDEDDIRSVLASLELIASLPDDGESPLLGTASRLLLPKRKSLLYSACAEEFQWLSFLGRLRDLVQVRDEDGLHEEYISKFWTNLRENYRFNNSLAIARQASIFVKCSQFK